MRKLFTTGIVYIENYSRRFMDGPGLGPRTVKYAATINGATTVALPVVGTVPHDLLVIGSTLYLLHVVDEGSQVYKNIVSKTTDLGANWTEVLYFYTLIPSGGIARSFTYYNNNLYFGIGTYYNADPILMSNAAGRLMRNPYTP